MLMLLNWKFDLLLLMLLPKETSSCSCYSFEFIEATGKSVCVPAKSSKFEWAGKAVKN